ncbi:MAG: hypothetical protein HFF79_08620 [Oscillospiraceae bacterium]|nr:hypothetical protein [Oscillospiraceae bacterium]
MNELQRRKAVEALEKQKQQERKKNHAMMYRLGAYTKLHCEGVMLPYKVLYDLEKAEHEKTFTEVPPNPFYPAPAITLKTKWSTPKYEGDESKLPLKTSSIFGEDITLPDLMADDEYRKKCEEYEQRVKSEKLSIEKWDYWYARFLLPYDLSSFTDFDWWGELPKTEEEREVINNLKAACMEVQADCRGNPQDYNTEPVLRKEEHKNIYDVPYGYI